MASEINTASDYTKMRTQMRAVRMMTKSELTTMAKEGVVEAAWGLGVITSDEGGGGGGGGALEAEGATEEEEEEEEKENCCCGCCQKDGI